MSSTIKGERQIRRILRRVEPEVKKEIREAVERAAQAIHYDQLRLVPKDTGQLARALEYRISKNGFQARIGLVTPKIQRQNYYARFVEFGTKGGTTKKGRRYGAKAAQPFIAPSLDLNKDWAVKEIREGVRIALERASGV